LNKQNTASNRGAAIKIRREAVALLKTREFANFVKARELLEKWKELCTRNWPKRLPLYNIACCEALMGNNVAAMKFFREALDFGFNNVKRIEKDRPLDSLRDLPEFKALVASIEPRPSRRQLCRRSRQLCRRSRQLEVKEVTEKVEVRDEVQEVKEEIFRKGKVEHLPPLVLPYVDTVKTLIEMGFVNTEEVNKIVMDVKGDVKAGGELLLG